jgi:TonB family protein
LLLTEALTVSEELYGSKHAALGPVLNELSRLHLQRSQHARAEDALERLLAIARLKGPEHLDVAAALAGLAFVKRKLGDDGAAAASYSEALRIREKVLEPNHTLTVGTMEQLSETCAARGDLAGALALLQRALPAREATLGAGHERVRAMRSRVAKLELEIAIAADTAAAAAAKAARDATPTPVWLRRVPDVAAPSPTHSTELVLLGEPEPPALRSVPRARDRAKTPAVAAAVAAASLMASSIPTPSASRVAIASPESARPSGSVTGRHSGAVHRDLVLVDVVRAAVAQDDVATADAAVADVAVAGAALADVAVVDVAVDNRHSAIATEGDAPASTRKNRALLFASVAAAAAAIVVAGMLMSRPRTRDDAQPASAEMSVAQSGAAAAGAPVAMAAVTTNESSTAGVAGAAGAPAVVRAPRADSLPAVSTKPARTAVVVQPEQSAAENAPLELRAPRVEVHVDPMNMPTVPAALSVDSILRSAAERQRASDSERTVIRDRASVPVTAAVDTARIPPRIIGPVPEPRFPDVLVGSVRREGLVVVRFMVNERGTVDVASMIVERSDHERFTAAVRDILPRFRFEPAHTRAPESKPVAAWVTVPFRFAAKR